MSELILNPVVDYRTRWSGVRPRHLQGAVPFAAILKILAGKVVVGHAISNDFKALRYFHPPALTRDTSRMPLLNRKGGFPENVAVSLKRLVKQLLNRDIQVGKSGHSSVEDARATMELYKVVEAEWEQQLEAGRKTPRFRMEKAPVWEQGGWWPWGFASCSPGGALRAPGIPHRHPQTPVASLDIPKAFCPSQPPTRSNFGIKD
uniref:Interferon stimulated exonuclease gene 20 like 2 n=1 Tax=Nothoprocta perdicaria TaxID=30464 RepID=A0A8C6YR29_NOTPE